MKTKTVKRRILITGSGGMLGQAVYQTFRKENEVLATDIDLNEDWIEFLDVRDLGALFKTCESFRPEVIINLAAHTDLEYCEDHPEEAFLTNGLGQENVCLVAGGTDIPVIYISSAGIFDGSKEIYNDFDTPNPLSIYGKSKFYGEICTQKRLKRFLVFRAGWMMGGFHKDKKFIRKIHDQLKAGKRELHVISDKLGTPTYTWDFAQSMEKVLATEFWGLYNMVCEGGGSRYDVAVEFVKDLGLEDTVKIHIVPSDFFRGEYFAPRPRSEQLVNLKLKARNILYMRDWRICLKEYAEAFPRLNL